MKCQVNPMSCATMIAAALVALCLGLNPMTVAASEWTTDFHGESTLFAKINEERTERRVPRLSRDPALDVLARQKALDMAKNGYFSHVSSELGTVYDMLQTAGKPFRWAGENIARGSSIPTLHQALMDSPDHRANILSAGYSRVGVGVVQYRGKKHVAQIFMHPR